MTFAGPGIDGYDNWQTVWTGPRAADSKQYVASQTGVLASSSQRFTWWKALSGADGVTRHVSLSHLFSFYL